MSNEEISFKCLSCGGDEVRVFYEARSVPVNSVLLISNRERALTFPTGDIRLGFCADCGFIFNTSFERKLVEYSSRCEESQGFSAFFRAWHEELAQRLVDRYALYDKQIIEIGCGKGEFLALLCELGHNRGVGFDPAYIPDRLALGSASRVEFIADFYSERNSRVQADFLCCKMTLEHIAETGSFINMIRASLRGSPGTCVFFQVPDVLRVLHEQAFWDIYYEHCSYFSAGSLARLFHRAGFDVLNVGREYDDQYLTVEARIANETRSQSAIEDDAEDLGQLVDNFAARVPSQIAEWRRRLESGRERGRKTVIWGAGSKGVTFLSTLDVPGAVKFAVDINPNMWGHYLAKTGLEIVKPSVLSVYRPDLVIVMNPVYQKEIIGELANIGLTPEVIST